MRGAGPLNQKQKKSESEFKFSWKNWEAICKKWISKGFERSHGDK